MFMISTFYKSLFKCIFLCACFTLFLSSCSTRQVVQSNAKIVYLENQLGIDITPQKDPVSLYSAAANWLGVPYRFGGYSKKGIDCSGLTVFLFRQVYQIELERRSADIYKQNCTRIHQLSNLRPGDLVFFCTGKKRRINHVGIYLKNNQFIHASTRGGVRVDDLRDTYYRKTFYRAGRLRTRFL